MSNELRIRAIADVAQAKAAIQSLNAADAQRMASGAKSVADSKKQEAELLQIQLNNAKATKASADEVKRLAAAYSAAAAEARVAAGEARVLERASRAATRDAQRQVLPAAQTQAVAPAAVDKSGRRANKYAFSRIGVGEGMLDEGGGINIQGLMAGLAAGITAAIAAGFKQALEAQRAAQKELGGKGESQADMETQIQIKAQEMGATRDQIAQLLSRVSSLQGVASSKELGQAALSALSDGGIQGAMKAVADTARGPEAITSLQRIDQERRRTARRLEIQSALTVEQSLAENAAEEDARARRIEMEARGGGMNPIGQLAGVTAGVFAGEQGRLATQEFANRALIVGAGRDGSRFRSIQQEQPQRVEVVNTTRRLGGD